MGKRKRARANTEGTEGLQEQPPPLVKQAAKLCDGG